MANKNQFLNYTSPEQRLGNKPLFTTAVSKDGKTTRYFSGTDAEIYFGETYIDDVVQIEYQLQQNTMPLFGYNSYVYDEVALGSRLISGRFVINFTKASYLYDVLNVLVSSQRAANTTITKDRENTIDEFEEPAPKTPESLKISSHGPMWNKAFEIVLSYGNAKQFSPAANSTMAILTGVVLTGCSQVLGMNGEPIYETYNFIARDINFPPVFANKQLTTPSVSSKDIIEIKDISYTEEIDPQTYKPYGVLGISYNAYVSFEKTMIELKIDTNKDRGMRQIVDDNKFDGLIKYKVPDTWREAIKQYCMKDMSNLPNSILISLIFHYKTNGVTSLKQITEKARLLNVYSNL